MHPKKISIPEPCQENWHQMSDSQNGKYCQACEKEVIDFSKMSMSEIADFFAQYNTNQGKLCGRITQDQMDFYNATQYPKPTTKLSKWSFAAALTAFLMNPSFALDPPPPMQDAISMTKDPDGNYVHPVLDIETNLAPEETVLLEGRVVDKRSKAPILGAIIEVYGTNIRASSDENGYYKLRVPKSTQDITLSCYSVAYQVKSKIFKAKRSYKNLVFKMTVSKHTIYGGISF